MVAAKSSLVVAIYSVFFGLVASQYKQQPTCPPIWKDVAADLKSALVDANGACNDNARASIRLAFHDCFPGACDGSVILSDECTTRSDNAPLVGMCDTLGTRAKKFNVGAADIIQLSAGKSASGSSEGVDVYLVRVEFIE